MNSENRYCLFTLDFNNNNNNNIQTLTTLISLIVFKINNNYMQVTLGSLNLLLTSSIYF